MVTTHLSRRDGYATTSRGLDFDSVPMRLFQKAKRLGTWDPNDIDVAQDAADWTAMSEVEQRSLLRLITLFQAGEEAVTLDLLPLIMTVAREGRVEEEVYLTSFLWEEAKHVEWFRRWLDGVVGRDHGDLMRLVGESYKKLFQEELPESMNRLLTDASPANQVRASVTYNMVVEGVLAETGYYSAGKSLEAEGRMPGLLKGMKLLQRDESRHIRYGVYLLNRLVAQDDALWQLMNERMNELFPLAMGVITESWEEEPEPPFGLELEDLMTFAGTQFDKRMKVLERDRGKSLAEIDAAAGLDMEADSPAEEALTPA
jgi:ribonucleoside-diphosphate reductase beta chain